jgi:glutamate dehydrogenase
VLSTGCTGARWTCCARYSAYAFQVGAVPARFALPTALLKHPHIARMMFDMFQVKFDPDRARPLEERQDAAADVKARI